MIWFLWTPRYIHRRPTHLQFKIGSTDTQVRQSVFLHITSVLHGGNITLCRVSSEDKMARSGYVWRGIQCHNVQPVAMRRYLYSTFHTTASLWVMWDFHHPGVDTGNWFKLTILGALAPCVGRPAVAMFIDQAGYAGPYFRWSRSSAAMAISGKDRECKYINVYRQNISSWVRYAWWPIVDARPVIATPWSQMRVMVHR